MGIEDFISQYLNPEETLYPFSNEYYNSHFVKPKTSSTYAKETAKDVFHETANQVKRNVHTMLYHPATKEIGFMVTVFLLRTGLYFTLKRASEQGYQIDPI